MPHLCMSITDIIYTYCIISSVFLYIIIDVGDSYDYLHEDLIEKVKCQQVIIPKLSIN
jgi:hypothetical protein